MKQQKARVKQKFWDEYIRDPKRCIACGIILTESEFIFCKRCRTHLVSLRKDPEILIEEYKLAGKRNGEFNKRVTCLGRGFA